MYPYVDFSAAEDFADRVCREGKTIYENALSGLRQAGVDIRNPLQLLYVLKKMGPQSFEQLFSETEADATDMFLLSQRVVEDNRPFFESPELRGKIAGRRFLLASTDVHEHAIHALAQLLTEAGAEVSNLGAEQSPNQVVDQLQNDSFDAILLSTHNGMALDYARMLQSQLRQINAKLPVLMGGVLNQKIEGEILPVPVVNEISAMGFHPAIALPNLSKLLS